MGNKSKDARELELKLEVPASAARRIQNHPLLKSVQRSPGRLEAVYFDTPDFQLSQQGFSLRVRREGDRFVQTLKQGGEAAGIFDRGEWESALEGPDLDDSALEQTPIGTNRRLIALLEPVGRTTIDRAIWVLQRNGESIEVALDRGRVEAGASYERIAELELELKSGQPGSLFHFARELALSAPVRIGVLSKGERVQRLALGTTGKAEKATKIELDPDWSVAQAFATISQSCLRQFRLNEHLIVERCEASALHQARVSMRRLRASLSLFGSAIRDREFERLREELRWFTSSLGDARNIDVFLNRYEPLLSVRDRKALISARKAAYKTANSAIDSDRLRTLLLDYVEWLETGSWRKRRKAAGAVGPFAIQRLDRLWDRWCEAGAQLATLDEEQRHRFRIQVKKLRYAVEFLGSLFNAVQVRKFTKALESMQDSLGDLNDLVTARELAGELSLAFDPGERLDGGDRLARAAQASARLRRIGPFWSAGGGWLI